MHIHVFASFCCDSSIARCTGRVVLAVVYKFCQFLYATKSLATRYQERNVQKNHWEARESMRTAAKQQEIDIASPEHNTGSPKVQYGKVPEKMSAL